jgi:hypothetical protein
VLLPSATRHDKSAPEDSVAPRGRASRRDRPPALRLVPTRFGRTNGFVQAGAARLRIRPWKRLDVDTYPASLEHELGQTESSQPSRIRIHIHSPGRVMMVEQGGGMGDKGGKKDKEKHKQQQLTKHKQEEQKKQDKARPKTP